MKIIAIDPGTYESGWLVYDTETKLPISFGICRNEVLTLSLRDDRGLYDVMVIEMAASFGMPVGKEVFETCVWVGRFIEIWWQNDSKDAARLTRQEVKLHLCHSMRAKDSNIRQAILDRYPPSGGGAIPQIGTKAKPGPLYGISKHVWAALAIAIVWSDTFAT